MPATRIGFYLHSPLIRNPSLAIRKIRARCGALTDVTWTPPPESFQWQINPTWAEHIRNWARRLDVQHVAPASEVVFGHTFSRQDLLRWCEHGPDKGAGLQYDIKVPWEFSRGYSFPLRLLVAGENEQAGIARLIASEINEWVSHTNHINGPMWTNAMEVAIRAINWTLADDLSGGAVSQHIGIDEWRTLMWRHGQVIEARLEAKLISSNHYLANLLGLSVLGSHAATSREGERWRTFAENEFPAALMGQCFPDGGAYEASLPYHALITEMVLLYMLSVGSRASSTLISHARAMTQVVADTCRATGDVFPVGDDDSGRIIAIDRIMTKPARGQALLALAELVLQQPVTSRTNALYPASGWWVLRNPNWHLLLEFGGVGFAGKGAHAHNDTLTFCADWRGLPLLIDPGSYLYSGDPKARHQFRSASVHNGITIDDREPLPLGGESLRDLFSLPGPHRSARIHSSAANSITVCSHLERCVSVEDDVVTIRDAWRGQGRHTLTWSFHFAPGLLIEKKTNVAVDITLPSREKLVLASSAAGEISVLPSSASPSYGNLEPSTLVRFSLSTTRPLTTTWTLAPIDRR